MKTLLDIVEQDSDSSYIEYNNCDCDNTCYHRSGSLTTITCNTTCSVNTSLLDSSINLYYRDWSQE